MSENDANQGLKQEIAEVASRFAELAQDSDIASGGFATIAEGRDHQPLAYAGIRLHGLAPGWRFDTTTRTVHLPGEPTIEVPATARVHAV